MTRLRYPSAGSSRQYFGQSFKSLRHLNEEGGKGWVLNGGATVDRGLLTPVGGYAEFKSGGLWTKPTFSWRLVMRPDWDIWALPVGTSPIVISNISYQLYHETNGNLRGVSNGIFWMEIVSGVWQAMMNVGALNHYLCSSTPGSHRIWINGTPAYTNPYAFPLGERDVTCRLGSALNPQLVTDFSFFGKTWSDADAILDAEIWGCR